MLQFPNKSEWSQQWTLLCQTSLAPNTCFRHQKTLCKRWQAKQFLFLWWSGWSWKDLIPFLANHCCLLPPNLTVKQKVLHSAAGHSWNQPHATNSKNDFYMMWELTALIHVVIWLVMTKSVWHSDCSWQSAADHGKTWHLCALSDCNSAHLGHVDIVIWY